MLPAAAALTDALRTARGAVVDGGRARFGAWRSGSRRRSGRPGLPRLSAMSRFTPRLSWRLTLILIGVFVLLVSAWFWIRDSSLVAATKIRITGLAGADAPRIRTALLRAAKGMSTLHVRVDTLRTAVAPYPVVSGISVHSHPPHRLTIVVTEHTPVALLTTDGREVPVAADGTLLSDAANVPGLPVLHVSVPPGGTVVTAPGARAVLATIAAAPTPLRSHIQSVERNSRDGLLVRLRNGPPLHLGGPNELVAKWEAVARVLTDPATKGAAYVDVRVPWRPAVGGLADGAQPAPPPPPPPTAPTADTTTSTDGTTTPDPSATGATPMDGTVTTTQTTP